MYQLTISAYDKELLLDLINSRVELLESETGLPPKVEELVTKELERLDQLATNLLNAMKY